MARRTGKRVLGEGKAKRASARVPWEGPHVAGCVPESGQCHCREIVDGNAREELRQQWCTDGRTLPLFGRVKIHER